MDQGRLNSLTDTLIEYVLNELENTSDVDSAQRHRLKAMKLTLQERSGDSFDVCIGMGIAEAVFSMSGEKKSGALGSIIERLVKQWIARPLNQEVLKEIVKK